MAAVWNRINTVLLLLVLFALLGVIAMLAAGVRGGPLDPAGAPASTDSVKLPGVPISSLPYIITEPGSYYLTRNLTAVSGSGITINANNVTLDLMGFSLIGGGTSQGIVSDQSTTRRNNAIRNGVVRGWDTGIYTDNFIRSTYEDLRITNNTDGLRIGSGNSVTRVMAGYNSFGLVILQRDDAWGGSVADSNFSRNTNSGIQILANNIWVRNSVIDSNGLNGIWFLAPASYNQVTDNRIAGNGGVGNLGGIYFQPGANANLIARNVLIGNVTQAIFDNGTGNRIATFVSDVGPTVTNPLSNVVY